MKHGPKPKYTRPSGLLFDEEDRELVESRTWHVMVSGYAATSWYENGRSRLQKLHRLIMGDPPPGYVTDHINRNKLDNRRSNLRFATYSESAFNRAQRRNAASGYKGVYRVPSGKWVARVHIINNGRKHLGYFDTPAEAARAIATHKRKR